MKLCPQCDFIYDDDQDLCDMDGEVLECAPGVLPDPQRLTGPPPPQPARPGRLRLPALLISGVILGTVLPTGYYVHTRQAATGQTDHAPAGAVKDPQPETTPVPDAPAPAPDPSPESPPTTKVRQTTLASQKQTTLASQKRAGRAAQVVRPAQKPSPPPAAKREVRERRPESADNKKGSKLGAVLKKTGRILKKPFEF